MNFAAESAVMSPMILLAVLFLVALFALLRGTLRGMRRQQAPGSAHAAPPLAAGQERQSQSHVCPACSGFGFTTRMQPKMETRQETQTEFYTDYSGRPATRTVTRPRTVTTMQAVRVPCASCGGTGRSRS